MNMLKACLFKLPGLIQRIIVIDGSLGIVAFMQTYSLSIE